MMVVPMPELRDLQEEEEADDWSNRPVTPSKAETGVVQSGHLWALRKPEVHARRLPAWSLVRQASCNPVVVVGREHCCVLGGRGRVATNLALTFPVTNVGYGTTTANIYIRTRADKHIVGRDDV